MSSYLMLKNSLKRKRDLFENYPDPKWEKIAAEQKLQSLCNKLLGTQNYLVRLHDSESPKYFYMELHLNNKNMIKQFTALCKGISVAPGMESVALRCNQRLFELLFKMVGYLNKDQLSEFFDYFNFVHDKKYNRSP